VKGATRRLGRTRFGRNLLFAGTIGDPRALRFSTARWWPDQVRGFEDLVFLFSSNQLNHGIVSQELDEAARLYHVARDVSDGSVVEIGRFKGGSTFLLAAALQGRAELWSFDIHVEHEGGATGAELDAELQDALRRYGLDAAVHLVVGDSRSATPPDAPVRMLFIDGDHSYEGVAADWAHWEGALQPGGHVLFHDAVDHGGIGTTVEGVTQLVDELNLRADLIRQTDAGGIAHFVKR
jgi:predicted O-methyltransferase YrrM